MTYLAKKTGEGDPMKFAEMLERYSMLDGAGQERLLEEFELLGEHGDMAALYLSGYLATPVRVDLMESAVAGEDPELLLAFADFCAREYGHTAAGRRRVCALCRKGSKSSYAPLLNKLGVLIAAGCGCTRNVERAGDLFRKAKALGSADAARNLAFLEKYGKKPAVLFALPQKEAVTAVTLEETMPQGAVESFGRRIAGICRTPLAFAPDLFELKIG